MNEVIKLHGVAADDPEGKHVGLLTWDKLNLNVEEFGKSLGVDKLLDLDTIKSISIHIDAGKVGYLDVECYGLADDVKKRTRGKPVAAAAIRGNDLFQDGPASYVVRFPLMSLSATAFGPIKNPESRRKATSRKGVICGD